MSQQDLDTLRKYQAQADRIVEALFEVGSEKHDKCQRIAFMGGTYPLNETMLGGFGRRGLKAWLTEQLMALGTPASGSPIDDIPFHSEVEA